MDFICTVQMTQRRPQDQTALGWRLEDALQRNRALYSYSVDCRALCSHWSLPCQTSKKTTWTKCSDVTGLTHGVAAVAKWVTGFLRAFILRLFYAVVSAIFVMSWDKMERWLWMAIMQGSERRRSWPVLKIVFTGTWHEKQRKSCSGWAYLTTQTNYLPAELNYRQ
jgi:hypothetical protein